MSCPDGLTIGFGVAQPLPNAICATRSYFGQDDGGAAVYVAGTGFLVRTRNANSWVLTAAHNLYHPGLQRDVIEMRLHFGRHGNVQAAERQLAGFSYPREYTQSFAPSRWDFGIAQVPALDAAFVPVPLDQSTAISDTGKLLIGYPDEDDCEGAHLPYHSDLLVFPSGPANYGYRDQLTYVGMSGGPLLARPGPGQPIKAYGLHIRGPVAGNPDEDRAVRFSQLVLRRILGWMNG